MALSYLHNKKFERQPVMADAMSPHFHWEPKLLLAFHYAISQDGSNGPVLTEQLLLQDCVIRAPNWERKKGQRAKGRLMSLTP